MYKKLTKKRLLEVIKIYKHAWEHQNPKEILSIFTEDAIYHERVLRQPMLGHGNIEKYWKEKVVKGQENIEFTLQYVYVAGQTGIAEWEVWFDDKNEMVRKHMKEVAILDFRGELLSSLREYWSCEVIKSMGQNNNEKTKY